MNSVLEPLVRNFKLSNDLATDIRAFFTIHNDPGTLEHTLKVAEEAKRVAQLYHADSWKAEQAGLLHDISNVIPIKDMLQVAEELSIEVMPEISWELPGEHPYLSDIRDKVDEYQLLEGVLIYLNHIWEQREKMKLVHPWLIQAREEFLKQS